MKLNRLAHVFCCYVFGTGEVGYGAGDFEAGGDGAGRKAVAQGSIVQDLAAFLVQLAEVQNLLGRKAGVFDSLSFSLCFYGAGNVPADFFGSGQTRSLFYISFLFTFIFNKYTKVYAVQQGSGKLFPVLLYAFEAAKTDF